MRRLQSHLDHVAIAVHDLDQAGQRWRDQLGGQLVGWSPPGAGFASRQLRYRGGGKLELIAPVRIGDGGFMDRFLERFGNRIHHVTLKVPDLHEAIDVLRHHGLDVVDVDDGSPHWQEGFLRPSQVGGLIVQIAYAPYTDDQWSASLGHTPDPVAEDAAILHGPLLGHPDLDVATQLWTVLGADVRREGDRLTCRWSGDPLDVIIVVGENPGPIALRFSDAVGYPAATRIGPAVLPQ